MDAIRLKKLQPDFLFTALSYTDKRIAGGGAIVLHRLQKSR
jgi:hypothetical protein